MDTTRNHLAAFFVGAYGWVVTIFFGMVLLDIQYANLLPEGSAAFSEVSDYLLLIYFGTFLSAAAAIAFAWKSKSTRNLLIASQVVLLSELLMPAFFSLFLQDTQGNATGPILRIIAGGTASLLAFLGMYRYYRQP